MKKFLVVFLLLSFATTSFANPKTWLDQNFDKIGHGLLGGTVAGISYKRGADANSVLLNTAIVGLLKEAFDVKFGGQWDNWDWLATIVGGAVIVVL